MTFKKINRKKKNIYIYTKKKSENQACWSSLDLKKKKKIIIE